MGFDYATKRPLDDFLLPPGLGTLTASGADAADLAVAAAVVQPPNQPLVSSLPVVGILGRQHHVDAIYHDLHDDLVYVFVGTKFYTFQASDFKVSAACLHELVPRNVLSNLHNIAQPNRPGD